MILIVGGRGAGKHAVATSWGFSNKDIVGDVQELVRGASVADVLAELADRSCVICDEVGCGVVPLDAADRAWREDVGRLCCALAARADTVVRVTCGIPQVIKGEMPAFGAASHQGAAEPSDSCRDAR